VSFGKVWTDAMLDRLARGVRQGQPYAEIALALGTTKNAVISRAHRLALASHRPQGNPMGVRGWAAPNERERRCQWIEGEVPDCLDAEGNAPICGAPVEPGTSYCAAHLARATVRVSQSPGPDLTSVNGTRVLSSDPE